MILHRRLLTSRAICPKSSSPALSRRPSSFADFVARLFDDRLVLANNVADRCRFAVVVFRVDLAVGGRLRCTKGSASTTSW
jgi:hypothetical protein